MATPPPVSEKEKDGMDIEKSGLHAHSPDDSDVGDSTLAALQRVKTADEHHPIHWSSVKKWFVVIAYCLLQVFVTLTTTTYVSAEFLVQEQFGGTTQVVALGQSMFIIGTAIGPAFLGPLSYVVPSVSEQAIFRIFFSSFPLHWVSCVLSPSDDDYCCASSHGSRRVGRPCGGATFHKVPFGLKSV